MIATATLHRVPTPCQTHQWTRREEPLAEPNVTCTPVDGRDWDTFDDYPAMLDACVQCPGEAHVAPTALDSGSSDGPIPSEDATWTSLSVSQRCQAGHTSPPEPRLSLGTKYQRALPCCSVGCLVSLPATSRTRTWQNCAHCSLTNL